MPSPCCVMSFILFIVCCSSDPSHAGEGAAIEPSDSMMSVEDTLVRSVAFVLPKLHGLHFEQASADEDDHTTGDQKNGLLVSVCYQARPAQCQQHRRSLITRDLAMGSGLLRKQQVATSNETERAAASSPNIALLLPCRPARMNFATLIVRPSQSRRFRDQQSHLGQLHRSLRPQTRRSREFHPQAMVPQTEKEEDRLLHSAMIAIGRQSQTRCTLR